MLKPPMTDSNWAAIIEASMILLSLFLLWVIRLPDPNDPVYVCLLIFFFVSLLFPFPFVYFWKRHSAVYKTFRANIQAYIRYRYGIDLTDEQLLKLSFRDEKYYYTQSGRRVRNDMTGGHWFWGDEPFESKSTEISLNIKVDGVDHAVTGACILIIEPKTYEAHLYTYPNRQMIPFQQHASS